MEQIADVSEGRSKIFTLPNVLSFFRLCLIPLIIWLYCAEHNYLRAGNMLIISGLTDIVDGFIARKFNMVSDLGKILDPIADKLTQAAMLICLVARFPMMGLPLVLLLIKEIFMGITGILVIKKTGSVYGARWHGKIATFLLDATIILHIFWNGITPAISTAFIISCTISIVLSLVLYGKKNIKALNRAKQFAARRKPKWNQKQSNI